MASIIDVQADVARILLLTCPSDVPALRRALTLLGHRLGQATAVQAGRAAGLPSRFALARLLTRERLPPFRELRIWTRLLAWTMTWEGEGVSLAQQALDVGSDPAHWYRTVLMHTGKPWREVQQLGSSWVIARFGDAVTKYRRGLPDILERG